MKMISGRFLRAFIRKWRKLSSDVLTSTSNDYCPWVLLTCNQEGVTIPKDVPKGHMVVYVGEECKRFVIQVTFLKHPMFRALLDRAQEEYEFNPDAKLCIPCDENIFICVLRAVGAQQDKRIWLCF